jgi:16S rRNA (uracil1498-N3)-methyltransferase
MPRFYCPQVLNTGASIELHTAAARHAQVLRLQPSQTITLFNGAGGEFEAVIEHMGRHDVRVLVGVHHAKEREARYQLHLAVVMPANDRMDWLVEKATELGVHRITPLMSQHSVVRLQAVAISACEQCGRNTVPQIDVLQNLSAWLSSELVSGLQITNEAIGGIQAAVLSLHASTQSLSEWSASVQNKACIVLNGPEGGLTDEEDALARTKGFAAVNLGERVLRAETAALAALAYFNVRG